LILAVISSAIKVNGLEKHLKALALARSNDRKNKFSNAYQFQTLAASVWNMTSDFFALSMLCIIVQY